MLNDGSRFQYYSASPYYQSQLGTNWSNTTQILNKIQSVNSGKEGEGCLTERDKNIKDAMGVHSFVTFHPGWLGWYLVIICVTYLHFLFLFVFTKPTSKCDLGRCTFAV